MPEDWAFPVAVIIGLAIVLGTSWDRFDEPTYTKKDKVGNKYYLRFQPRFIALRRKYGRARLVYVGFMCAAYLIVSTTPWLADFIPGLAEAAGAGDTESGAAESSAGLAQSAAYPLAVAAGLMGFQTVPYLKTLETKCRRTLHTWAKVPKGASDTIMKLMRSDFDFSAYRKLDALKKGKREFEHVAAKDFEAARNTIENDWAKICCTLHSLRLSREVPPAPGGFDQDCYSDAFFDEYEPEHEEILMLYRNLAKAVSYHKSNSADGGKGSSESRQVLQNDLRSLLEKIYSFVACAVRSKQTTESNVVVALNKLGFAMIEPTLPKVDKGFFVLAALGLALIFPLIAIFGPKLFDDFLTNEIDKSELLAAFPYVPLNAADGALWAVSTILIQLGAAGAALGYRSRRVRTGDWDGSIEQNALAAVLGGCAGFALLSLMSAFHLWTRPEVWQALSASQLSWQVFVTHSLVWTLLPVITASFAVFHRTTGRSERSAATLSLWCLGQGVVMALAGFVLGLIFVQLSVPEGSVPAALADQRGTIEFRFELLASAICFLIGAYLGWLFPYRQRSIFRQAFEGDWVVDEANGGSGYISLQPGGVAIHQSTDLHDKRVGRWTPQGHSCRIDWENGEPYTAQYIDGEYGRLKFVGAAPAAAKAQPALMAQRLQDPRLAA